MTRSDRRALLAFFVLLAVVLYLLASACTMRADAAPPRLYVAKVTPIHVDGSPAIRTVLSNGKRDVLKPCRYEDGRHCYWVGDSMGNGKGRSFIVTRGHVFYLDLSGIPT